MEAEKQEKTDDQLIAEFMGGIFYGPEDLDYPNKWWFRDQPHEGYRKDAHHLTVGLRYHIDWSWLMPVVDTIASLDFAINTYYKGNGCRVSIHEGRNINGSLSPAIIDCDYSRDKLSLIDTTYKAIVEFIKWYNSQKPLPL